VRPLAREHLRQQLAITDLVRVKPNSVLRMLLGLVEAADGEERVGAVLVCGIITRALRQKLMRESKNGLVITTLEGVVHLSERRYRHQRLPSTDVIGAT